MLKNLLVGLLIIFAFIGGYFFSQKYDFKLTKKNSEVSPTITSSTQENLVGNDVDEHGCRGSAGYSWCEIKQKCLREWEESCLSDEEAIKQAMVDKYGWDPKNIIITITKNDGRFARGGIKERSSEVGGGMFLAAKRKGLWDIAFAGNGVPDCLKLKTVYLFPNEILTGVCD